MLTCDVAGAVPGQALLMANMVDVFTLTGKDMENRGDFYASMFIVLAAGCLMSYFALGYFTNNIAQVRYNLLTIPLTIRFVVKGGDANLTFENCRLFLTK